MYVFYNELFHINYVFFQMLAFSTLDAMLSADTQHTWLMFMSSKGYLQHFVDSLVTDNEQLINMSNSVQQPLKALYIYQSKMVNLNTKNYFDTFKYKRCIVYIIIHIFCFT